MLFCYIKFIKQTFCLGCYIQIICKITRFKDCMNKKLKQTFIIDDSASIATDHADDPHIYTNYNEYLFSLIGFAVGYGSFWRFPYLVYKNGGGVFLIPYFLALIILGIPLLYLQTAVGQMHRRSVPIIYERINKGLKFVGMTFLFSAFHLAGYYNIILTYSYRFIISGFNWNLPFADQSPKQNEYFAHSILNKSQSINEFGGINPLLFFIYVGSLVICYFVIRKGVKTSGKIITFTAIAPYFLFIILFVRGIFLDGAGRGIKYLFMPDISKLFGIQIWIDAIVQVFFQMTIAVSGIINLSSMKPKRQGFLKGIYIIPTSLVLCGMLCALNIFMYLGHFTMQLGIQIDDLKLSGPQLSFNIFPKALAILPFANMWIILFFVAMVFLGIDSQFGYIQSIFCYLKDEFQKSDLQICGYQINFEQSKKLTMILILIFCPTLTSYAGIYYLQFYDSFVTTIPFSLGALIQLYTFVYLFPFSQLKAHAQKYTKQKTPQWIQKLLTGRLLVLILLINFGLACLNQFFFFFKYSFGFYLFGWFITSYPYIIAYFYYKSHKQSSSRLTFEALNERNSHL